MNSENILAVNIPNIVSITLMALLGFAALHMALRFIGNRGTKSADEAEG